MDLGGSIPITVSSASSALTASPASTASCRFAAIRLSIFSATTRLPGSGIMAIRDLAAAIALSTSSEVGSAGAGEDSISMAILLVPASAMTVKRLDLSQEMDSLISVPGGRAFSKFI